MLGRETGIDGIIGRGRGGRWPSGRLLPREGRLGDHRQSGPSLPMAVELRRGEMVRCLAQDLLPPPELWNFRLQSLQALPLIPGQPQPPSAISFRLPDPLPQRFRRVADLLRKRLMAA